jgi:simple sugar transport system permease protein
LLVVSLSGPLILAAMGGFASERSGVVNIGLEGLMLMAACVTALVAPNGGPWLGVAAGVGAAVLLSLLHWMATQTYRIDHVVSGMALNALAAGGTNFLYGRFHDPNRSTAIPTIPEGIFQGLALGLPFLLALYMVRTRGGLRLLATGNDPDKARLAGLEPLRIRLAALMATGVFAGLAGAMLISETGIFTDNMTAGRGYIALAALILGGWRVLPALVACSAFGFLSALRLQLQGSPILGIQLPSEAWAALPYGVTLLALAGSFGKSRAPGGLGKA